MQPFITLNLTIKIILRLTWLIIVIIILFNYLEKLSGIENKLPAINSNCWVSILLEKKVWRSELDLNFNLPAWIWFPFRFGSLLVSNRCCVNDWPIQKASIFIFSVKHVVLFRKIEFILWNTRAMKKSAEPYYTYILVYVYVYIHGVIERKKNRPRRKSTVINNTQQQSPNLVNIWISSMEIDYITYLQQICTFAFV